jgi:hypothetical protein
MPASPDSKSSRPDDLLPVVRAAELQDSDPEHQWLIESLFPWAGVSILGASPKLGKTWIGLDLAVSVASGTPCLGRFATQRQGSALIYLAEDSHQAVKARLLGICRHRNVELATLPVHVITAPTLRLDLERDQRRLEHTVRTFRPALLLLDPFVRLQKINENDAGEVAGVLGYLRSLQRTYDLAVIIIHHARKNGPSGSSAGSGLRGSVDFYAFADSVWYLRQQRDQLLLTIEHRSAPPPPPIHLALVTGDSPHMEVLEVGGTSTTFRADTLDDAVLALLAEADAPLSRAALRTALGVRTQRLSHALARLAQTGLIARNGDAWTLSP